MATLADEQANDIKRVLGRVTDQLFRNLVKYFIEKDQIKKACEELEAQTGEKWTFTAMATVAGAQNVASMACAEGIDARVQGRFVLHHSDISYRMDQIAQGTGERYFVAPDKDWKPELDDDEKLVTTIDEKLGDDMVHADFRDNPAAADKIEEFLRKEGIDSIKRAGDEFLFHAEDGDHMLNALMQVDGMERKAEELADQIEAKKANQSLGPIPGREDMQPTVKMRSIAEESMAAQRREDIGNTQTTADYVQARPDTGQHDKSNPYGDGNVPFGQGDVDGDGIRDSADDINGDGFPDEGVPDELCDDATGRGVPEVEPEKRQEAADTVEMKAAQGRNAQVSMQQETR